MGTGRTGRQGVDNTLPAVPVSSINVTIETGTDDLKYGVMVYAINRVDGQDRMVSFPAMISQGQKPHSTYGLLLQMVPGTQVRAIDKVRLEYIPVKCDLFDSGDSWNIKRLKVSYNVVYNGASAPGVLMHKRGAPAKRSIGERPGPSIPSVDNGTVAGSRRLEMGQTLDSVNLVRVRIE